MRTAILLSALTSVAFGQTAFEVASVRPVPNIGYPGQGQARGGPGTSDPGRLTFEHATLALLVRLAYGVEEYQVSGPSWIEAGRFDIAAKVPEGATKEQSNLMLRNLLVERFKLKLHHETRELQAYELTVAKGGPKFKESTPVPDAGANEITVDKDGLPWLPAGRPGMMTGSGMISARQEPLSKLTSFLEAHMRMSATDRKPVVDKTGLTGAYDFALRFVPPIEVATSNPANGPSDPAPDVFTAVQQYLGLNLAEKKLPLDVLVIDSAEKTPEEN